MLWLWLLFVVVMLLLLLLLKFVIGTTTTLSLSFSLLGCNTSTLCWYLWDLAYEFLNVDTGTAVWIKTGESTYINVIQSIIHTSAFTRQNPCVTVDRRLNWIVGTTLAMRWWYADLAPFSNCQRVTCHSDPLQISLMIIESVPCQGVQLIDAHAITHKFSIR